MAVRKKKKKKKVGVNSTTEFVLWRYISESYSDGNIRTDNDNETLNHQGHFPKLEVDLTVGRNDFS